MFGYIVAQKGFHGWQSLAFIPSHFPVLGLADAVQYAGRWAQSGANVRVVEVVNGHMTRKWAVDAEANHYRI